MSTISLAKVSCISVVFTLFGLVSQAQPVANFSANPVSGCAPLVVSFSDLSSGAPTQWRWDLGNGTISFLQNPSVTYFNPGQYTVKLVVQNVNGADSITRIQYITIYEQPAVNFSASSLSGCFPLPVQFTDLSVPGSGSVTQWEWDFGDGNSSTQQNPSHTYTAGGNYNVSLRITNSNGCFKTLTRLQYVQISNGVHAEFTNMAPTSCAPPVNITFQNLSTGTGALSYSWNFGDGSISSQANPVHIYNNPGSYTVQLIVTNSTGCADTMQHTNAVTIGTVNAAFTSPATVCSNESFSFTNTSDPLPAGALWDFGDGTTSTTLNPVKAYLLPGTYTISLLSNFGACTDVTSGTITVLPKPQSVFTATPLSGCRLPLNVTFNNNSANAVSASWNFGDGTTSTVMNPSHIYTAAGNYTVTLISTNSLGCTDTLVRQQYISVAFPQAIINNLPQNGCAPLAVSFSPTVISNEPVVNYLWDFGDGNTSGSATPVHVFAAGIYNITLTIITANGCTDTATVMAGVNAGIQPAADFNANPADVCAMIPVNFFDLSAGTVDQWQWDFGDGGISNLQNPIHVYEDTGYFDVQLIVYNNGCSDTIQFNNYIHINPPIALYRMDLDCSEPGKRIFTDMSIGADSWNWDFGDGSTSSVQNPVHNYTTSGTYSISLTVSNNQTGCTYTKTYQTIVVLEAADFNATDTIICRNTGASFTAFTASANTVTLEWTFGDGGTASGITVSHIYALSGSYDVSLITTDINGCHDTIIKQNYIRVNGPTANFGIQIPGTCSMNAVPLSDSSLTDGIHTLSSWTWNYGDGVTETLSNGPFQHTYNAPGVYSISLNISDTEGCTDSLVQISLLTVSQPVAEFNSADTASCPGSTISFTNLSTGPGLTQTWNFGDGTTSTLLNPTHIYSADGIYTVSLNIIDQYGCTASIVKNQYIRISTPHAAFLLSDTVGTCPPLVVNFTNNSDNFSSFNWNFGDGTSSQSPNPSHFYSNPGTYLAALTVNGNAGCTSIKTQTIVVRGPQGSFTYGGLHGCDSLTVNFVATTLDRLSFIWDFNDGTTMSTTDSVISHTYVSPGVYIPKMILLDAGGCVVPITGPDTIKVNGAVAGFDFNTQNICSSGSVQFNNTTTSNDGVLSYHWDFGDGSTSASPDPVHLYSSPGTYFPMLTVTTLSGCTDSLTAIAPVKVVSVPQGIIAQSENGCTPLTVDFTGSLAVPDTSIIAWNWSFGNGHVSAMQHPAPETYTEAGNYTIILNVTNSSGCTDTTTAIINAFPVPSVNAGVDTMICYGTGINLNASGAATYTWNSVPGLSCYNCASPVANPDSLTKYIVIGTTVQGCSNVDSVIVNVKHPFNMLHSAQDSLCLGSSVQLQASGAYTYSWSPAAGLTNSSVPNPRAAPFSSTVYQVIGTDDHHCFSDTAYVPILVFPVPTVEAGPDITVNVGQMTDLIPVISADVNNVTWSPTGSIFRTDYPGITVKPRETTTYHVEVTNAGGCTASDNLTVYVICNGANVFIPNTFSPNGDGSNDIFYPRGTGLFTIKNARIFNRWGEVVYERNNFQANDAAWGWDGTYKGTKLNPDVYVYIIEIVCDNNTTLPFKGNVALIK